MKYEEALKIISDHYNPGYIVRFNVKTGNGFSRDYFPNDDEEKIKDVDEAYKLARKFAKATEGKCFDVEVCKFIKMKEDIIEVKIGKETDEVISNKVMSNKIMDSRPQTRYKEIKIDSEITDSRPQTHYNEIKIDSEITDSRPRPSYTEATYTDANGKPYYKS